MSLSLHANVAINTQRKLNMKPDIGPEFSSMCYAHTESTEWLFGDDLTKTLKNIGDENRIGKNIRADGSRFRYSPYSHIAKKARFTQRGSKEVNNQSKNFRGMGNYDRGRRFSNQ